MRSLKSTPTIPVENNAFQNCKLNRQQYAETLTSIVNNYKDGFVLSIDNEWGAGKTTFVKMWQQYLIDQEEPFDTLYFNAWENDLEDEPLVAILAELKSLKNGNADKITEVIRLGAALTKSMIPVVLKAFVENYIGAGLISNVTEAVSKDSAELFSKDVEEYSKRKDDIKKFKQELTEYLALRKKETPLVFFIDELDRCKPDYSVKLLEVIKHFFSVDGIIFVLSIDKEQLSQAIRGYYGSANFNAEKYLKRFIDLEFQLPSPEISEFIDYLYKYYNFDDYFNVSIRLKKDDQKEHKQVLIETMKHIFSRNTISPRSIKKIIKNLRIALAQIPSVRNCYPFVQFYLSFIQEVDDDMYQMVKKKHFTLSEFVNEIKKHFGIIRNFDRDYYVALGYSKVFLLYLDHIETSNLDTPILLSEKLASEDFTQEDINIFSNCIMDNLNRELRFISPLETYISRNNFIELLT